MIIKLANKVPINCHHYNEFYCTILQYYLIFEIKHFENWLQYSEFGLLNVKCCGIKQCCSGRQLFKSIAVFVFVMSCFIIFCGMLNLHNVNVCMQACLSTTWVYFWIHPFRSTRFEASFCWLRTTQARDCWRQL